MRFHAIFFVTSILPALFVFAAPVPEVQDYDLVPSRLFEPSSKAQNSTSASTVAAAPPRTMAVALPKTSVAPATTTWYDAASPSAVPASSSSSSMVASSSVAAISTAPVAAYYVRAATSATSSSAAASDSDASCPLYTAADAAHLSARDIREHEKRVGEELWFRYDDPSVKTSGKNALQLAARNSGKDFDDQAYKWISTDISKVTRGKIPKRVPTMYVLPAGTRASVFGAAQDFETTSGAKKRVDFVTKANEPGDIGIQGITPGTSGTLPLDTFRDKVIRVVTKSTSAKAGGKATFTTIGGDGKVSGKTSDSDKAALGRFC